MNDVNHERAFILARVQQKTIFYRSSMYQAFDARRFLYLVIRKISFATDVLLPSVIGRSLFEHVELNDSSFGQIQIITTVHI